MSSSFLFSVGAYCGGNEDQIVDDGPIMVVIRVSYDDDGHWVVDYGMRWSMIDIG